MNKAIKSHGAGVEAKRAVPRPYVMPETDPSLMVNDLLVPYEAYFKSPLAKLGAIKQGLRADAITDLLQVTGATQIDIAKWLDITEPTLRKHIQGSRELNRGLSEHIIQLFELFDKGLDTFGSLDEFKSWLKHYNPGIDAIPFELLDTLTGISIVLNQLIRIDYGVLA
ncbi:antitoxin Xre/MbcA/ParS toxin-binding domain-containing protein [Mucilaginibacter lappiensis]|jgi:putative toxin-antitoxin system antitoxin component (TIGR02293 family)|uniref:antitoxin Xre/MbcA/ParS toxin-binding domain-containing protein n=1 Tax=Mucilaginibacter lappiensis TaxID=354630 RepID=UPI003D21E1A6